MAKPKCPGQWEYKDTPEYKKQLVEVQAHFYARAGRGEDLLAACKDTRPLHGTWFRPLAPKGFEYYAGNYRGSRHTCLRDMGIQIGKHHGSAPSLVAQHMDLLSQHIDLSIARLDEMKSSLGLSPADNDREAFLREVIRLVVDIFMMHQIVHPFANGNGHTGRAIMVALLARYGFRLPRWIEPRPIGDPKYSTLIQFYREGNPAPLRVAVLRTVVAAGKDHATEVA